MTATALGLGSNEVPIAKNRLALAGQLSCERPRLGSMRRLPRLRQWKDKNMIDTRPEYPPEYDDATECVSCEGEFNLTIESPDHPHEPLENYCCSWQCYAIKLKRDIVKLRRGRGSIRV